MTQETKIVKSENKNSLYLLILTSVLYEELSKKNYGGLLSLLCVLTILSLIGSSEAVFRSFIPYMAKKIIFTSKDSQKQFEKIIPI